MATAVHTAPRRTGWRAPTAGELLAEDLGAFILICFGDEEQGRTVEDVS